MSGLGKVSYRDLFGGTQELELLQVSREDITWVEQYAQPDRQHEVVLWLGCHILRTAHLAQELVDIFGALGVDFVAVGGPQFCCGVVHHQYNDLDQATRISHSTMDKLASYGPRVLVSWCPSCNYHLDGVILKEITPAYEITHTAGFLAERVGQFPWKQPVPARVMLHTHHGRRQDMDAVLRLLESIPGVQVMGETCAPPEIGYHCDLISINQLGRRRFESIQQQAVQDARAKGCDTIVTVYHSCQREWCSMACDADMPVRNYVSLIAEALGCARFDWFQMFRTLRDPDAALSRCRPIWEANGIDETRGKGLLRKHFKLS